MKPPQILGTILAHLRAAGTAVSSRDLASRFLRIQAADEETCRRLLAPILEGVPGVQHRDAEGWRFDAKAAARSASGAARPQAIPWSHDDAATPAIDADGGADAGDDASLLDFVALAVDGVGPGGSGAPRALTFLPVVGGEEMQEENLPSWGLDEDGVPVDAEEPAGAMAAGLPAAGGPGVSRPGMAGLGLADLETLAEAVGDLPIIVHRAAREADPIVRIAGDAGIPFHPRVLSAARLGHLLLGLKANHAALDLASALGVEAPGPDDCRGRARIVARAYLRMLPKLQARGIRTVGGLIEYQGMPAAPLDLSGYSFTADDLRSLPASPGVYRFIDRSGGVIYIGKARNLRVRVGSYFAPGARGTAKGRAILEQVFSIETQIVASELEANLLEAALLAEHRPPLNRQFEIHERPAPYGPRLNLAVVLRDAAEPACTVHLLRGGRYLKRLPGITGASDAPDLHAALDGGYFLGAARPHEETEIDWAIVSSWLRRNQDEVGVLDVDECSTAAEAVDRLGVLVRAALAGAGKVVAR